MDQKSLYIGLMSGTSLDGVDAALVEFQNDEQLKIIATHAEPFTPRLREDLLELCQPGDDEINRMGVADVRLGHLFAEASLHLIHKAGFNPADIAAIGSHGQTIRHHPSQKHPFTLQIGDPNIIAAETGVTTVADFRRRDVALGGQGAPFMPTFHRAMFQNQTAVHWVLNIGGMANLSYLPADETLDVTGFDTGPGNTLMDAWSEHIRQLRFDDKGVWATGGEIIQGLLDLLLADPYFDLEPPKSTGRELFNLTWLENHLSHLTTPADNTDVAATLLEFTAQTITDAILEFDETPTIVWLCGGGVRNEKLMSRLKELLPKHDFKSTTEMGIDPDWMEAVGFAWFARQTMLGRTGNTPSVTGACKKAILGGIYHK